MSSFGKDISIIHEQCAVCKFGKGFCPIATAQLVYDQEAKKNGAVDAILDILFDPSGVCSLFNEHERELRIES